MTKYEEYDTFRLSKLIAGEEIPVGTRGVVLMVFEGTPREYEVEFPDGIGGNLGQQLTYTITSSFMAPDLSEEKID